MTDFVPVYIINNLSSDNLIHEVVFKFLQTRAVV